MSTVTIEIEIPRKLAEAIAGKCQAYRISKNLAFTRMLQEAIDYEQTGYSYGHSVINGKKRRR